MAIQMGPASVADPQKLVSALRTQAPPQNPKTPLERLNPDQQFLENIKAASVSVERAQQFTNDEQLLRVLNVISGTLSKALLKFDAMQVTQFLQEAVASFPPPVAPAMGAAPGQPGAQPPGVPGGPAAPPGMGAQPSVMPSAEGLPQ